VKGCLYQVAFSYFSAMIKKLTLMLLCMFTAVASQAQPDSSHIRVSLLTCGVGDEIWETFGHTGVRIVDSVRHLDVVYNYGTFDGFDKDFEINFMRGKLLYYVSMDSYQGFMQEYVMAQRKVEEQLLLLSGTQKQEVYTFLRENALPQNRNYKYDFFFDNCATRIRDIFPRVLGKDFHFAATVSKDRPLTFRNIINQYFYRKHWERVGVNLLLGKKIDKVMTSEDIMFLPDYLRDGVGGSTVNGTKVSAVATVILQGKATEPAGTNEPIYVMLAVLLLTILGLFYKPLHVLGKVMTVLVMLVTGLLGILMLFMWVGTDHQACQNNLNILWALPTNLIALFVKRKERYASLAIGLIILSLLLHIFKVQELPLLEIWPLLLSLLCIHGMAYKRSSAAA